jgi:lipopolysaccharide biosynthesis protein
MSSAMKTSSAASNARSSGASAALKPLAQLRVAGWSDGEPVYAATGDDPQLLWSPSPEARKALVGVAGVQIRWSAELIEGQFVEPCVYVDWGDGFTEDGVAALQSDGEGGYMAFVAAQGPACRRVRIDPSLKQPCTFRVREVSVTGAGELVFASSAAKAVERFKRALGPARGVLRRVRRRGDGLARRISSSMAGWTLGDQAGGRWRDAYNHNFAVTRNLRSEQFAAPALTRLETRPDAPRLMAFYLPQFHPFPENDRWWGKGFTEWTNVTKAMPQFAGHYQPRLAGDLGYYDLRTTETMREQIALARNAGVHGFCFHYYWFAGKRLLERPLDAFVADKTHDFPFSLCWANENWTRRWDGQDAEILIAQEHSPQSDLSLLDDMARYMRDPRYVRVDGKPLLIVYRPDALPDAKGTLERWRTRARDEGLGELHILCSNAFGFADFKLYGFDGLVQFPPHAIRVGEITNKVTLLNPAFSGKVYDYPTVAAGQAAELSQLPPEVVPGVIPSWDNEARRSGAGNVFHGATPEHYRTWLSAALAHAEAVHPPGRGLVFVNAWNEWAEGAYLEPDRWFGHGYLQATRAALAHYAPKLSTADPLAAASAEGFVKRSDAAVILHLYYEDLLEPFADLLRDLPLDAVVTVPDTWTAVGLARLRAALPNALVLVVPNQGRDILPFLHALRIVAERGYERFCKVHAKRSPHLGDGDRWRDRLTEALLAPEAVARAQAAFAAEPDLGLLGADFSRMGLDTPDVMHNNRGAVIRLAELLGARWDAETVFPAGSMFWGRTSAFGGMLKPDIADYRFEPEMGRIDGTTAHALERLFGAVVVAAGQRTAWTL